MPKFTTIRGGPIGANMTSEERAEYNRTMTPLFLGAVAGEIGGYFLKPLLRPLGSWLGGLLGLADESVGGGFTTVGRWMSSSEYQTMSSTNQMVEGAGGQTFVGTSGPEAFTAAPKGSVYAEFDVPTKSLLKGGKKVGLK